mmetsp:Transcript_6380/g.24772  ORF Transcript_6380/g.24772 Transcript_6380/m.24772 type:complete len:209 (+) Transcript_6380:2766-3392(+)
MALIRFCILSVCWLLSLPLSALDGRRTPVGLRSCLRIASILCRSLCSRFIRRLFSRCAKVSSSAASSGASSALRPCNDSADCSGEAPKMSSAMESDSSSGTSSSERSGMVPRRGASIVCSGPSTTSAMGAAAPGSSHWSGSCSETFPSESESASNIVAKLGVPDRASGTEEGGTREGGTTKEGGRERFAALRILSTRSSSSADCKEPS